VGLCSDKAASPLQPEAGICTAAAHPMRMGWQSPGSPVQAIAVLFPISLALWLESEPQGW